MNKVSRIGVAIVASVLMLTAVSSWGQAPPNNDTSDGRGNTAGGSNALADNTSGGRNSAWGYFALATNTTGHDNTASGLDALLSNTTGNYNTASGEEALRENTTGLFNTATGWRSLELNTASDNTATGVQTLLNNSTGIENTATGVNALLSNTTGNYDTATGVQALFHSTTGSNNTADGVQALFSNTSGTYNTAAGANSLYSETTGHHNSALGGQALYSNTSGYYNSGVGLNALYSNTSGFQNTSLGVSSLFHNTTGQNDIGIGYNAGSNPIAGSNNIEIGNVGAAADTAIIRIGTQGTQTQTLIAGIVGSAVTGSDVVVNASGKLGVVVSSARYKRDIHDMGDSTDGLMKLRPVTFVYKGDQQGVKQYGLVAEEVDKVYPELVVHDDHGKVESVRYSMLTSMLLNELQKQTKKNELQAAQMTEVKAQLKVSRERELAMCTAIEGRLSKIEQVIAAKDGNRNLAAAFSR